MISKSLVVDPPRWPRGQEKCHDSINRSSIHSTTTSQPNPYSTQNPKTGGGDQKSSRPKEGRRKVAHFISRQPTPLMSLWWMSRSQLESPISTGVPSMTCFSEHDHHIRPGEDGPVDDIDHRHRHTHTLHRIIISPRLIIYLLILFLNNKRQFWLKTYMFLGSMLWLRDGEGEWTSDV